MHVHEIFLKARGWPAECCLGDIPEEEALKLIAEKIPAIQDGIRVGLTTRREMGPNVDECWLRGRGYVI